MDWPEELIVGGTVKNRSKIIRRCGFFLDIMGNLLVGNSRVIVDENILIGCEDNEVDNK